MLTYRLGKLKKILIILIVTSLLILITTSCLTSPHAHDDPEISEYLTVELTPEFPDFSGANPELDLILQYALSVYSTRLKDLYAMQKTGAFISADLQEEIGYCQDMIDWIGGIVADIE